MKKATILEAQALYDLKTKDYDLKIFYGKRLFCSLIAKGLLEGEHKLSARGKQQAEHQDIRTVTSYEFGCGYIQEYGTENIYLSLYLDGTYHVRVHDTKNNERVLWESFDNLTQARKAFAVELKKIKAAV